MFFVALFCANAVLGVKFTSQKTDYVNNWDAVMNYHAGRGKIITGIADSVHDNNREDRRFKFYYTDGAEHGISCEPGSFTSYRNGWDGVLDYRCPSHHALNAVYSFHDNHREDRLFRFKCCDIRSHGKFYIHSVHKTNLVSDYDGRLDARCNPNSVLVGLYSYHDNNREDRRWHMYCGIMQERAAPIVTVSSPSKTGWINSWDGSFAWTAPVDRLIKNRHGKCIDAPNRGSQRRVITYSCSESNANQQWEYNRSTGQIKLAGVNWCLDAHDTGRTSGGAVRLESCNTNNRNQHWEYDAGTGLVRQQHGGLCLDAPSRNSNNQKLHMIACSRTNYNQLWDVAAGGYKAIVGLESEHNNHREDRLWKTYYASTPGVRCNPSGWTDYQNLWDGTLDYRCPHNQILAGFGSYHDNHREDRRYRFRCCDVGPSGFHIAETRDIGRLNEYDAHLNFVCARNEVLVGLKGWHDNNREDRRFHGLCGTLSQNPPDYDDCSEVNVVDVEVGDIETGDRTTKSVAKYTVPFKACGNSITPGMSTLNIETSTSVSKTESLELGKSLEQSFKFSSTIETSFKFSKSVTAEVSKGVASASATVGMEFGLTMGFTAETGTTMGSSETRTSETGTVDVNVVSISNTFDPEPYQWREAQASYIQQDVIVPLRMKAQCKRKDGRIKELWIDSTLTAAAYSQVEVDFVDRTHQCPQSYYKSCQCVNQLKSNFITSDGCQTHPFFEGHPGCYVFKGNNCGNGQGLGTAEPVSFVEVCTDADRCPNAKLYIDYPLDEYVWEWSYQPCGGDRYYPGDPGYTGPHIDDFVTKMSNKHCREGSHGTLGTYSFASKVQAILKCDELNEANPGTCSGVYDPSCDNRGHFHLCDNTAYRSSSSSCIYRMQEQNGRRRAETGLPKAPESLPVVAKTDAQLIEEFGDDLVDEEEEFDDVTEEDDEPVDGMTDEDDEDAEAEDELEAPAPADPAPAPADE